jgi:thiosulfate/3-mercaptopyruvate sulfurtransferase
VTEPLPALVSTAWLASRLGRAGLRVVDGSWYMPASHRDPAAEYVEGHIPGAVFFDLDASSDPASPLPHMLPAAESFARRMSALGLRDDDHLVVYDGSGVNLSAPRVWWMFCVFGHERVAVLDGGIGKWRREGRPLETGMVHLPPGRFPAALDRSAVRNLEDLRRGASGSEQIVDLRSAGRFAGTEPEPQVATTGRSGSIPAVAIRRRSRSAGSIVPSGPTSSLKGRFLLPGM